MRKFDFEDKKVKLYTQKNIIEEQLDAIDLIEHLEKLINTEFYEKMYNCDETYLKSARAFTYFLDILPEENRIYGDTAYSVNDGVGNLMVHDIHILFMLDKCTGVDMLLHESYYVGKEKEVKYNLQMGCFRSIDEPEIEYHPANIAYGPGYVEIYGNKPGEEKHVFALFDTPNANYSSISEKTLIEAIGTLNVEDVLGKYAKDYFLTTGDARKPMY